MYWTLDSIALMICSLQGVSALDLLPPPGRRAGSEVLGTVVTDPYETREIFDLQETCKDAGDTCWVKSARPRRGFRSAFDVGCV